MRSHEVETTRTGEVFRLERTPRATDALSERFKDEFHEFEAQKYDDCLYDAWMKNCADAEVPAGVTEEVEAMVALKKAAHDWLAENAEKYGYRHSATNHSEAS